VLDQGQVVDVGSTKRRMLLRQWHVPATRRSRRNRRLLDPLPARLDEPDPERLKSGNHTTRTPNHRRLPGARIDGDLNITTTRVELAVREDHGAPGAPAHRLAAGGIDLVALQIPRPDESRPSVTCGQQAVRTLQEADGLAECAGRVVVEQIPLLLGSITYGAQMTSLINPEREAKAAERTVVLFGSSLCLLEHLPKHAKAPAPSAD
jgi:hypothetical protein